MKELAGKVAVVTGAGSGIGRGMARAFSEAGMHVVIGDIDLPAAEQAAAELDSSAARALPRRVDVTSRQEVDALAESTCSELGGVHLLCNNAGVTTFGLMCDGIPDDDWAWVLAVNLQGVINGLQAFLPRLREQPGDKHIVNTASIAGISPSPLVGPYAASKHAVLGLTDTLRAEAASHGISCSVLCPSNVNTRIVEADRNRQPTFGGPKGGTHELLAAHVAAGIDPDHVGRMVRQAVIDDVPFIFTHADTRELVDTRYQTMQDSLTWADRWRTSNPEPSV